LSSGTQSAISFNHLFPENTENFLVPFRNIVVSDIQNGMNLNFDLVEKPRKKKISPILVLATPEDAEAIVDIYFDIYDGTYPYKEMEDVKEVRRMIESDEFEWLLFKNEEGDILGCFTYELDFFKRMGYMRGFNIKKKYQGKVDVVKACIGSMIAIWTHYKNKIDIWYCENRTAHSNSQYIANVCGIKPLAFLPNKDIFLNKKESVLLQVAYSKAALENLRTLSQPKIINPVSFCYSYSNEVYNLGKAIISNPNIKLNLSKLSQLMHLLKINSNNMKFDSERIKLSFEGLGSYFEFKHNKNSHNFEKVSYKVNSIEELFIFINEFKCLAKIKEVEYMECLVSAYLPEHQKLFFKLGFKPMGYLPSWEYNNRTQKLEDRILFNLYASPILAEVYLINEAKRLLEKLKISNIKIR